MRVSSVSPTRPAAATVAPIGAHASRGALLLMTQAVAIKIVTFGGGIVMARLLVPSAYGLFGMATAAAALPALVQGVGATEVLIQRSKNFRRWANASFWMSLTLGVLSCLLTLGVAPIAGFYYAQDQQFNRAIVPLVALIGVGSFFSSLGPVPAARLQIDLRFGFQARLGLFVAMGSVLLGILLAWLGFGVYALLIPFVLGPVARGAAYWLADPVRLKWHTDFKRWKYLMMDRWYIFGAAAFQTLISQGDYLTLGHLRGDAVTGIYFWAFNLSMQSTLLVGLNLAAVLFPSLSRLSEEPERLAAAFLRAVRLLVVVAVPLCFLQVVVAVPVIRVLFKPEWHQGIPIFQILSVGMAFQIVTPPLSSLWSAQGRFRALMNWSILVGILFLVIIVVAAHMYEGMESAIAVAVAVSLFYFIIGPVGLALAFRGVGIPASRVFSIYATPLVASALSAAAGLYVLNLLPGINRFTRILQMGVGSAVMLGLYAGLLWMMQPALARETAGLFRDLIVKRLMRKMGA